MSKPFIYQEVLKKFVVANNDNIVTREEFIISFSRLQHIERHKMPIIIDELVRYGMIKKLNKKMIEIINEEEEIES